MIGRRECSFTHSPTDSASHPSPYLTLILANEQNGALGPPDHIRWRCYNADLLKGLSDAGAEVVAYDLYFDEGLSDCDQKFAEAIEMQILKVQRPLLAPENTTTTMEKSYLKQFRYFNKSFKRKTGARLAEEKVFVFGSNWQKKYLKSFNYWNENLSGWFRPSLYKLSCKRMHTTSQTGMWTGCLSRNRLKSSCEISSVE